MIGKNSFKIYDSKTKEELKRGIDETIRELELHGVSIKRRSQVNKVLSRRFGGAVRDEIIEFSWNPYSGKSTIALYPQFRLVRLGEKYVTFLKKEEPIKK